MYITVKIGSKRIDVLLDRGTSSIFVKKLVESALRIRLEDQTLWIDDKISEGNLDLYKEFRKTQSRVLRVTVGEIVNIVLRIKYPDGRVENFNESVGLMDKVGDLIESTDDRDDYKPVYYLQGIGEKIYLNDKKSLDDHRISDGDIIIAELTPYEDTIPFETFVRLIDAPGGKKNKRYVINPVAPLQELINSIKKDYKVKNVTLLAASKEVDPSKNANDYKLRNVGELYAIFEK